MPIAELTVIPVSGDAMKPVVDSAIETIRKSGIKYQVGPLATTLEGDLDQIIEVAKNAHRAALAKAKERVITELRIDEHQSSGH